MKLAAILSFILLVGAVFAQDAVSPLQKPQGIDLDVTVIERTPRYPGYKVDYSDGSGMGSIDKAQAMVKHWPDPNEAVTFTGRIINKGTQPSPSFDYIWLMDGKKVRSGTVKTLAPGESAAVNFTWNWKMEPHVLKLIVDPDDKVKETFEQNNTLVHDTLAKVLHLVVSQDTYDRMNDCPNLIGTYSCEDQLNWYINHMNEMFKNAIYPMTPNGSRERVRAEFLIVKDAQEKDDWYAVRGGNALAAGYDGAWWHDYSEQTAKWAAEFDWGLPHELGHQLGIIDLYQLDCSANGNRALDEDGDPVMIGHWSDMIDSMMHGHGPVPWSEHTAYATDTHFTKRRGFYGAYLVAMPKDNYVQILDNQNYPVEGAKITVYQTSGNRIPSQPVFSGTTDASGKFLLPNRPAGKPAYVNELGYEFHDNPFGAINCVGANGLLFMKIEARGHTEYQWLEITKLNLAYWRGAKDQAVYPYATHIPHLSMPPAPKNITVKRVENGVKITWDKCPDAPAVAAEKRLCPKDIGFTNSVIRYNVYRAVPDPYNWTLIGTKTSRDPGEFIDTNPPRGLVRYAVTAVNTAQSESAFSKYYGYSVLGEPMGICALPDNRLIVADHADNQLIFLKPNGSVIGPWNSEHNHGYCTDVAVAKDGMVAYTDWPDGYDPEHVGFFLHFWNKDEMGEARKWTKGTEAGQILEPGGIAFDDDGNVLLTDSGNNRILCLSRSGNLLWSYSTGLNKPSRAIIWKGNLVIADTGNGRVLIVDPKQDRVISEINELKQPRYVALDASGNLIVSETGAGVIRFYDKALNGVKLVAWYDGKWHIDSQVVPGQGTLKEPIGVASFNDGGTEKYAVVDSASKSVVFFKPLE